MIVASWPGPISGRVSWIAPGSFAGQPSRNAPVFPLIAYSRDVPPACDRTSLSGSVLTPLSGG